LRSGVIQEHSRNQEYLRPPEFSDPTRSAWRIQTFQPLIRLHLCDEGFKRRRTNEGAGPGDDRYCGGGFAHRCVALGVGRREEGRRTSGVDSRRGRRTSDGHRHLPSLSRRGPHTVGRRPCPRVVAQRQTDRLRPRQRRRRLLGLPTVRDEQRRQQRAARRSSNYRLLRRELGPR